MNRRDALERVALILGGTIIGGSAFLQGCKTGDSKGKGMLLTAEQMAFLDEVAETIIPTTDTPGAKAAGVGAFMNTMVTDCYTPEDQQLFIEGITNVDAAAQKQFNKGFMELEASQRSALLDQVNQELRDYNKNKTEKDPAHYFSMMKQLTLLGYFSSEVGATQALRYVAIPGKYEGCIPYKKGDRAWA
jgi:hypothetical protein